MPAVIVTCPSSSGPTHGFYSSAGYFPDGETRVDLSEEQLAALQGEIARKESVLTVRVLTAEELVPKEIAADPVEPAAEEKPVEDVSADLPR